MQKSTSSILNARFSNASILIAGLLNSYAIALLFYTGFYYLFTHEFTRYHAAAIQTEWQALPENLQFLILIFLKALGTGALVCGLAMSVMLTYVAKNKPTDERWLIAGTGLVGGLWYGLFAWFTFTVHWETGADSPRFIILSGLVATLLAATLRLSFAKRVA